MAAAARPRFCGSPAPVHRCTISSVVSPSPFRSMPPCLPGAPAASGRRKAVFAPDTAVALAGPRVTGAALKPPVSSTRNTVSSRSPSPLTSAERSVGSGPRMKTFALSSLGWGAPDKLVKATKRPSAEMDGPEESRTRCMPSDATLTLSVMPVRRS